MKVKELIQRIEADGWVQARQRGSHRQFKNPTKPGTITVSCKSNIDVPPDTLNNVLKQASLKRWDILVQFTVIVEKGSTNWGAYVPDVPGCVAAGETPEETLQLIREAIEFHLEGLKERGESLPEPRSYGEVGEVHAV